MATIKKIKEIRESLGYSHIIIFGVTKNDKQNVVSTHGETTVNAKEAAEFGNKLKLALGWPLQLCNTKPLDRLCSNCTYWQRGYHAPGDRIPEFMNGKCMAECNPVNRKENDRACLNFEPKY